MRTVNVAKLRKQLSKYLAFAKSGKEVVIRDKGRPIAKLVPFLARKADSSELALVAAEKLRLPKTRLDVAAIEKIPTGRVKRNRAIQAFVSDRHEGL